VANSRLVILLPTVWYRSIESTVTKPIHVRSRNLVPLPTTDATITLRPVSKLQPATEFPYTWKHCTIELALLTAAAWVSINKPILRSTKLEPLHVRRLFGCKPCNPNDAAVAKLLPTGCSYLSASKLGSLVSAVQPAACPVIATYSWIVVHDQSDCSTVPRSTKLADASSACLTQLDIVNTINATTAVLKSKSTDGPTVSTAATGTAVVIGVAPATILPTTPATAEPIYAAVFLTAAASLPATHVDSANVNIDRAQVVSLGAHQFF
jgi:hypothetical protein